MGNFTKEPEQTAQVTSVDEAVTSLMKIRKSSDKTGKKLTQVEARLGTEFVRTHRVFAVDLPTMLDPDGPSGIASAVLTNTPEFTAVEVPEIYGIDPHSETRTIHVKYSPTARGESRSHISFVANFADGYTEQQTIPVVANARELTDPTYDEPATGEAVHQVASTPTVPNPNASRKQMDAAMKVSEAVGALFDIQHSAVADVQTAQSGYTTPPPPKPVWMELVGVALDVGFGLMGMGLGTAAASRIELALKSSSKDLRETIGKSVEKSVEGALESIAERSKLSELTPGERKEVPRKEDSEGGSGDDSTDFFSEQKLRICIWKPDAQQLARDSILAIMDKFGDDGSAVANALESFKASEALGKSLTNKQGSATTAAFMKYVARSKLHTVSDGHQTTTVMAEIRDEPYQQFESNYEKRVGVLEITTDPYAVVPTIKRARCSGLSARVVKRISKMNLREARVPIVIRHDGTTITIDEAGRIRSGGMPFRTTQHGWLPRTPLPARDEGGKFVDTQDTRHELTEAEDAVEVHRFANAILDRTLHDHGLDEVETDDAKGTEGHG